MNCTNDFEECSLCGGESKSTRIQTGLCLFFRTETSSDFNNDSYWDHQERVRIDIKRRSQTYDDLVALLLMLVFPENPYVHYKPRVFPKAFNQKFIGDAANLEELVESDQPRLKDIR